MQGRRSPALLSPRDHPSSSEQAAEHGTKKKRMQRVQPEPTIVSDTLLKTMDSNPLGQDKDISPDDQDGSRMDHNNPAKVNDPEVKSRMWVSAPHTKQKKEDITKHKRFFCGLPKETIEKTFEATTQLGRIITGETLSLKNALKAPNLALNAKRRNKPVAMDTMCSPVDHPMIIH
jgi:hypothetical protein